nr:hypothetical protein [Tanacetum cinerariifolium]
MRLLDFVNSANPFKVKTGKRTLAENEVPLLTEIEDKVVSPVPSIQANVNVSVIEPAGETHESSALKNEARALSATLIQGSSTDDFYESQAIDSAIALNNAELLGKVSALELVHEELDGKVSQLTADCDSLWNKVVGEVKIREERDMYIGLYPYMLTAIAGWRWVVGHGFRLVVYKRARSVECRFALGKFILMAINKGIQQEELEGLKDSLLALIISALTLKDDHGETYANPELYQFQPSLDQVTIPIYFEFGSINHEMLLLEGIPAIHGSTKRKGLCSPFGSASGGTFAIAPF